jgi:hypothetical protein
MGHTIKLKESDLIKLINKVISESKSLKTINEAEKDCTCSCNWSWDLCPDGGGYLNHANTWTATGDIGMYGSTNCGEFCGSACSTHCGYPTGTSSKINNTRKPYKYKRLHEGKTRCNGKHVGGGEYNDPECTGGQECHRKAPFTNLFGCFDCVEGKRCGYDDMNYRPGMDTTYMDIGFEDFEDNRDVKGGLQNRGRGDRALDSLRHESVLKDLIKKTIKEDITNTKLNESIFLDSVKKAVVDGKISKPEARKIISKERTNRPIKDAYSRKAAGCECTSDGVCIGGGMCHGSDTCLSGCPEDPCTRHYINCPDSKSRNVRSRR